MLFHRSEKGNKDLSVWQRLLWEKMLIEVLQPERHGTFFFCSLFYFKCILYLADPCCGWNIWRKSATCWSVPFTEKKSGVPARRDKVEIAEGAEGYSLTFTVNMC